MALDQAQWRRLDRHLTRLLDTTGAEREALLAALDRHDPALAARLRRMLSGLRASEPLDRFASLPLYAEALAELPGIGPGDRLGDWQLLRRLGTGGMSEVFLARRQHNGIDQYAALKLLASGLPASALRSGFLHECHVLAALSDARIARYYDSGIAGDGRPWLAMEHVDGCALDAYLERHAPALEDCLALFRDIAGAVAHAHERLIVHRDLKPSNVMIAGSGQVKLLDFGIARAVDAVPGAEGDGTGLRLLTPEYASPEQLDNGVVGIASDIYQLGLLLYRLVAGRHLHEGVDRYRTRGPEANREREPAPPSQAMRRLGRPAREVARVRGDLDAIVCKAIAARPGDRYANVEALCADLDAWREGRAVQARRQTPAMAVVRAMRRHRVATAVTATVVLAGGVFAIAWADQALRAAREARTALAVHDLLASALYAGHYGAEPSAGDTVSTLLDEVEQRAGPTLSERPEALARTWLLVARARAGRGEYRRAAELLQRAHALPGLPPALHRELELALVNALHFSGDYAAARQLATAHLSTLERRYGDADPRLFPVLSELADLNHSIGDYQRAAALAARLLPVARSRFGEHDPGLAMAHRLQGMVQRDLGRFEPAQAHLQAAIAIDRAALGEGHVNMAANLDHLGILHLQRGDLGNARTALERADAIRGALFQPGFLGRIWSQHRLAQLGLLEGDAVGAIAQMESLVGVYARELGEASHLTALARSDLAWMSMSAGRFADAARELAHADAVLATLAGGDHPRRAETLMGLSLVALEHGDPARATELARQAHGLVQLLAPSHPARTASCRLLQHLGEPCTAGPSSAPGALWHAQLESALARLPP